jgi:molybdopterin-guanine dinucleotide biosynthesis protein A
VTPAPEPARVCLGGIVLAGGAGRRLGQPKAGVVLDGRTLVERAVATLRPHCGAVLVVSRPEVELPPLDATVCSDRPGPDAPLNALATGLTALDTGDVIVLACDLPSAQPVVHRLARAPTGVASVARDHSTGQWQPLCARYPRVAALEVCERLLASGEVRLLPLIDALGPAAIEATHDELANVNSSQDLARVSVLMRRAEPGGC